MSARTVDLAAQLHHIAPVLPVTTTREAPDAELLALSNRFLKLEARKRRLFDMECAAEERGDRTKMLLLRAKSEAGRDDYLALLDRIAEQPAHTLEGLRAKAAAVYAFYAPDPPGGSVADGVMWSLVNDLLRDAP
ncbi:hypothetical protein [Limobrevibacterium gyesilva]|uniref:Uncharacterized protein n=1 Tax=Limobrevibacterium gyesilva TaxID=2991712 RepID=A0AA42CIV7_9PROT|nr:hypothetical protein [Limobrevibacterium gyesilva]MCW3476327.1 hypothetical protein [Limobrevibacterium gyesilva]